MKVLVQWAKKTPDASPWVESSSSAWASLPDLGDPTPSNNLTTEEPGWVNTVNVQGVQFRGDDHIAIVELGAGVVQVSVWSDDARDFPVGNRVASVWTFRELAPDSEMGGAYNTRQTQDIYREDATDTANVPAGATLHPWSEFVIPDAADTRHGKMMSSALLTEHNALAKAHPRGWREWTDGLPAEEIDGATGELRQQRPLGRYRKSGKTFTWFMESDGTTGNDPQGDGPHSSPGSVIYSNTLMKSADLSFGATAQGVTVPANVGGFAWKGRTASGGNTSPNSAQWPTGDYRFQMDITVAGADILYGLLDQTINSVTWLGHFARVNAADTADSETKQQSEAAQSGTGLKLVTTGSVSWSSGLDTDRYEVLVSVIYNKSHGGDQDCTLQAGEVDDFADGPRPMGRR